MSKNLLNNHLQKKPKLRVLLIALEYTYWGVARHQSYASYLGLEEGFYANGVEFFTITTPWLKRAKEICGGKKFDQVWVELFHSPPDEAWMEWLSSVAPVRLGLVSETIWHNSDEYGNQIIEKRDNITNWLNYITHLAVSDEKDVEEIKFKGIVPVIWWPQAIPERFITDEVAISPENYGVFCGSLAYQERLGWLEHPELQGLLIRQSSSEDGTLYPAVFNKLHRAVSIFLKTKLPGEASILPVYLYLLRRIRRQCFALWLKQMQIGCAVIQLPTYFKAYSGRVFEGMAAGRPVISWEVPDRPETKYLFEDGKEILLYSPKDPSELADHIQRLIKEPDFGKYLVENARRKLRHFHTVEKRVNQILNWIENGENPLYY